VKRPILVAFCILTLCSLAVVNAGTVKAALASGYERTDTPTNTTYPNTLDGKWDPPEEWYDANFTGTNATIIDFGSTYDSPDGFTTVYTRWIIEFFTDNTTDAGDYWEMCIDNNNAGGGSPAATHHRILIEGHDNLTLYQGNGAGGWDGVTQEAGEIVWNNSIVATPWSSIPHWVLELDIKKTGGHALASATWGVRVAAYDDSNATQGVVAWPPDSERDVPNSWGTQNYTGTDYWETVPEGFSIAIVVFLSTAAMIVGFYFLRKKSKTDSLNLENKKQKLHLLKFVRRASNLQSFFIFLFNVKVALR
jgi:hypothetical protein